jgi:hypothetical protein
MKKLGADELASAGGDLGRGRADRSLSPGSGQASALAKDTPLTHDNENPAPTERTAQDVSLSLLTMANPAFRFSFMSAGFHRAKWLGWRRKPADAGVRAVAPSDLDEPQETADQANGSDPD